MIGARTFVKSLGTVDRPKERVVEVRGDHVIHCLENVKDIREGYHMEPIAPNIHVQPLEVQYGSPGPTFLWSKKAVGVKTPRRNRHSHNSDSMVVEEGLKLLPQSCPTNRVVRSGVCSGVKVSWGMVTNGRGHPRRTMSSTH